MLPRNILRLRGTMVVFFLVFASMCCFAHAEIAVDATLSKSSYMPRDTVIAALQVTIPSKYHLYGNPLGPGIGKPLSISAENSPGIRWMSITKEKAKKFSPLMGDWVWAYENSALFFVKGIIDTTAPVTLQSSFTLDGLICHDACVPVSKKIPFSVSVIKEPAQSVHFSYHDGLREKYLSFQDTMSLSSESLVQPIGLGELSFAVSTDSTLNNSAVGNAIPEWHYSPVERKIEFNLLLAILFGFIAGLILNVMPCVLPVLGIKILSFAQSNTGSRREVIIRSIFFSLGILSIFMLLASLAAFAKFSWGEQFQNPWVLVGIITLIVVFALGMFNLFTFSLPGALSSMERKSGKGFIGDFSRGVFATIMATPCSGPLLGATLAWTLTQRPVIVFTVFASIGLGMAAPYVVLSASRRLARMIPKPGAWMEDFKFVMGFVLLGMAVYLMIGLPKDMLVSTISVCLVVSFAVWIYARFAPWGVSVQRKTITIIISLLIVSGGIFFCFGTLYALVADNIKTNSGDSVHWVDFSPEILRNAHDKKQHVMVDFTANWCMNCQYNKVTVLHTKKIMDLVEKKKIITIKADLTSPDSLIASLMSHLGSRSVPFLAIFPGDDPFRPIVMRDLLNKNKLSEVLENLDE